MMACSKVHRQLRSDSPSPSHGHWPAPIWMWSSSSWLAAGLAYAAGYQTLARRIHKKFGGLRIY